MSVRQQPRPTMRDVAQLAGVSFKTVSRVVNGEGGVTDELAARVEAAVRDLGYRPDDRARRLRQGGTTTGAIGFALVDVANPFFSSILRGIEEVARRRDCLVLAGSTDGEAERERQLVEAFVARRVDGLIMVPSGADQHVVQAEIERGTPVVFLDLEPDEMVADIVRSDHYGGIVLATRHLLGHGHRDIAFFGDEGSVFSARLRAEGFRDTMRTARRKVNAERMVQGRHVSSQWRTIIRDYLQREDRPTAILTAQNFVTIGATQALHDLGLEHTVAHVGFDDVDLADVVQPGITVVPQRPLELGRLAAERLFERIDGIAEPPVRVVLDPEIIERGSGELRPPR